ncbi:MAG: hypothetical protein ACR2MA_05755 [Egibacteraceae bacterium]
MRLHFQYCRAASKPHQIQSRGLDDVSGAPPRAGLAAGKDAGDPLQFSLQLPGDAGEFGQSEAPARREIAIDGDRQPLL